MKEKIKQAALVVLTDQLEKQKNKVLDLTKKQEAAYFSAWTLMRITAESIMDDVAVGDSRRIAVSANELFDMDDVLDVSIDLTFEKFKVYVLEQQITELKKEILS